MLLIMLWIRHHPAAFDYHNRRELSCVATCEKLRRQPLWCPFPEIRLFFLSLLYFSFAHEENVRIPPVNIAEIA